MPREAAATEGKGHFSGGISYKWTDGRTRTQTIAPHQLVTLATPRQSFSDLPVTVRGTSGIRHFALINTHHSRIGVGLPDKRRH